MACGTGKTFTSLKIAEKLLPQIIDNLNTNSELAKPQDSLQETLQTNNNQQTFTLFLVPSISLLRQTLQEWSEQADIDFIPICVCSDASVGSKNKQDDEYELSFNRLDLGFPATTDTKKLQEEISQHKGKNIVIFSTYQSINIIEELGINFNLVICDEAHRTTGAKSSPQAEDSNFTKIHNSIKANKKIFMTATPRVYGNSAKAKADEDYILYSMDDETFYGKEFYTLTFGDAVSKNLLSDYKVLILTVNEADINKDLQKQIEEKEIKIDNTKAKNSILNANTDTAGKLIGCINALSKKILDIDNNLIGQDTAPMKTALAFCSQITTSKNTTDLFNECSSIYYESLNENHNLVSVSSKHIDGSMDSTKRNELLDWLKQPTENNECRILTNARCLSEGVDVPALDGIIFMNPRKSQIDIVQSIGRVMRKNNGKQYGYVILPLIIPSSVSAEDYLNTDKNFDTIWEILNALRSHDDRFQATIEAIKLNKNKPTTGGSISIAGLDTSINKKAEGESEEIQQNEVENLANTSEAVSKQISQLSLDLEQVRNILYAKIVEKCGDKKYWENWAKDISQIANNYVERIEELRKTNKQVAEEFNKFIENLKNNLNPMVIESEAIEMLAQHLISRPVFNILFNKDFIKQNPVSIYLENITKLLEDNNLNKENTNLASFYESVKKRISGITDNSGKQKLIIELYDKFFKNALPKQAEKLGIVYTPTEVIDFIINSTEKLLQKEFKRGLGDENIHILDPFTGTGSFITRLLQSGHISKENLERKYTSEIHANEILLLAYYIACVNIELTYMQATQSQEYKIFEGAVWTDTFNIDEIDAEKRASNLFDGDDTRFSLKQNNVRIQKQQNIPLAVIIGNPPYHNHNNTTYKKLKINIQNSYSKQSIAKTKFNLYDSYIKAFRYASDRLKDNNGIISFITNNGFLDSSSADGLRKCFAKEFTSIYIFNLKGLTKERGGDAFEGENIFGIRTGVSIIFLIKNKEKTGCNIYYHDISQQKDILKKEDKFKLLAKYNNILSNKINFQEITPDTHGDWINQRDGYLESEGFTSLELISNKRADGSWIDTEHMKDEKIGIFNINSNGLQTKGKVYCFNFSKNSIIENLKMKSISNNHDFNKNSLILAMAEPFIIKYTYYHRDFSERMYQLPKIFPDDIITSEKKQRVIVVGKNSFHCLMINKIIEKGTFKQGRIFPLYIYENTTKKSGINEKFTKEVHKKYNNTSISNEDIFHYIYGILHSPVYRENAKSDLKKVLPSIPLVKDYETFQKFMSAGYSLAELHLNYEDYSQQAISELDIKIEADLTQTSLDYYKINKKINFNKNSKDRIYYNKNITISNIPLSIYNYIINGKSPVEWVVSKYAYTKDEGAGLGKSNSGIINDPNLWLEEQNNPRYVLDLICSLAYISHRTLEIMESLKDLDITTI
jgi:predicted helicase